jgi:hypothetical protein
VIGTQFDRRPAGGIKPFDDCPSNFVTSPVKASSVSPPIVKIWKNETASGSDKLSASKVDLGPLMNSCGSATLNTIATKRRNATVWYSPRLLFSLFFRAASCPTVSTRNQWRRAVDLKKAFHHVSILLLGRGAARYSTVNHELSTRYIAPGARRQKHACANDIIRMT